MLEASAGLPTLSTSSSPAQIPHTGRGWGCPGERGDDPVRAGRDQLLVHPRPLEQRQIRNLAIQMQRLGLRHGATHATKLLRTRRRSLGPRGVGRGERDCARRGGDTRAEESLRADGRFTDEFAALFVAAAPPLFPDLPSLEDDPELAGLKEAFAPRSHCVRGSTTSF